MRYQLGEAITNGEFSVEVEGLRPDGPNHKLKIFSMNDREADHQLQRYGHGYDVPGGQRQPGKLHQLQGGLRQSDANRRARQPAA